MSIQKLTNPMIRRLPDGIYADGNGLSLRVQSNGTSRSWVYRKRFGEKQIRVGLGSVDFLSLDAARKLVIRINDAMAEGIAPADFLRSIYESHQDEEEEENKKPTLNSVFETAMRDITALKRWRNEDSERQWRRNIQTYVLPVIGDIPLDEIGIKEVLSIVEPIWTTKTETASRVLGQLATFLNWANVHEYRTGENPAQWNGRISMILPSPNKIKATKPHAAINVEEIPTLCEKLWAKPVQRSLAILFGILTATRAQDFIEAK